MKFKSGTDKASVRERHKELRIILLAAITCISFVPTTLLAILSFFHYQEIIADDQQQQLEIYTNQIERTLNTYYKLDNLSSKDREEIKQYLLRSSDQYDVFLTDRYNKFITPSKLWRPGGTFNSRELMNSKEYIISKRPLTLDGWSLIVAKRVAGKQLFFFQFELIIIYLLCIGAGLLLMYQLIKVLTRKLRESDIKRMALFSEISHTNRLTTLGKLAAGVAHEINNPLAALHQQTGLLHDLVEFSDDFPQKDKFITTTENIQAHVSRCQNITHQLLLLSQTGVDPKNKTDINELIHDLVYLFREKANRKKIKLQLQLENNLPLVQGAEDKIQQVLLKIITNAITSIHQNGTIQIRTNLQKNGFIEIAVQDNGKGIEPSVLKHLFDPFFTTKDTGEGTGLGLAIAHGLVKGMGGEISVTNLEAANGALFTVLLPSYNGDNENINS